MLGAFWLGFCKLEAAKRKGIAYPGDPLDTLRSVLGIGNDTPTGVVIKRVTPERLDRKCSCAQGNVG
ncbi:hypothetical protein KSD_54570 [Ktedonobacter sp. SOSP1-85]|nr:hypothetical protein KSD_54570 [Ktedonobacter sp. SOSP1-85]